MSDTPDQVKVEQGRSVDPISERRAFEAWWRSWCPGRDMPGITSHIFDAWLARARLTPPVANSTGLLNRAIELLRDAQYHLRVDVWAEEFDGRVKDFLTHLANQSDSTGEKVREQHPQYPDDDGLGPQQKPFIQAFNGFDVICERFAEPRVQGDKAAPVAGSPVDGVREHEDEEGEPDGPDYITALKNEIERQEGLAATYRRAQLDAEAKLCRMTASEQGWRKRCQYLEERIAALSTPATPTAPVDEGLREVRRLLELNDLDDRSDDDALEIPLGLLRRLAAMKAGKPLGERG